MALKLLLDSNKIYNKVFEGTKPGYDGLQVDSFLDIVMKDYDSVASYVAATDNQIEELNQKVTLLTEQLSHCEAENASLKARLGDVASNDEAALNNLELLIRISNLEKALSKVGVNPKTIK